MQNFNEVLEKVKAIDKRKGEIEAERVLIQNTICGVDEVFTDINTVFSSKLAEARLSKDAKKLKAVEEDCQKKKEEQEKLRAEAIEKDASLRGELESLSRERTQVVLGEVRKADIEDLAEFRRRLAELCDFRDSVIKQRKDLEATGIEVPIRQFERSLIPTDHAPEIIEGGDRVLFRRLQTAGLL
jgi:hypothetical protein